MEHNVIVISSGREIGVKGIFFPPSRVTVPEFEIYSNPTVTIEDVRRRRFSLIDRYSNGT